MGDDKNARGSSKRAMANHDHLLVASAGAAKLKEWNDSHPDERLDLGEAVLPGVQLPHSVLSRSNLSKADLREANFAGASLAAANLAGANLENANLRGALLWEADLSGA